VKICIAILLIMGIRTRPVSFERKPMSIGHSGAAFICLSLNCRLKRRAMVPMVWSLNRPVGCFAEISSNCCSNRSDSSVIFMRARAVKV